MDKMPRPSIAPMNQRILTNNLRRSCAAAVAVLSLLGALADSILHLASCILHHMRIIFPNRPRRSRHRRPKLPRMLHEIANRILAPGEPFVEGFLHNLARRAAAFNCKAARAYDERVGARPSDRDGYAVWEFMGMDRRQRTENYLWHDWARPEEYYALGKGWGLHYRYEDYADPNSGLGSRP